MKQDKNIRWQILSMAFNTEIESQLKQQHLAAQFIAITGRYLIPPKPDGSNINMQYIPEKKMLLGNAHPDGWTIGLQLENLKVQVLDEKGIVITEVSLNGKTFHQAFQEFKTVLQNRRIDVSQFKTEQPYELPTTGLREGKYFAIGSDDSVSENIRYRQNAQLLISELAGQFSDVEPVRIWPHHFDTGTFATLEKNINSSASKTIGLGWAIPDGMISEPYFYLSFWTENPLDSMNELVNLPAGKWMLPDWNGAVLRVSELIQKQTAEEQYQLAKDFFETGIKSLLKKMK